jgi:GNAT superfamily N-acetyltransferase
MEIKIKTVHGDECDIVLPYVEKLLVELGEEGDDLGELDAEKVKRVWQDTPGSVAFVAYTDDDEVAGIMTVAECFAVYANGNYGVINEMFVEPQYRSHGIGGRLVETAILWGRERGWQRIDVTAPESDRWIKARQFYEKQGFVFTGPKLKLFLQ